MKKTKKVAIYDPYLRTLGGGERYILQTAKVFDKEGFKIDLLCNDSSIGVDLQDRFGLSFKHLKIIPNFLQNKNIAQKTFQTANYDYLFSVTDGSYFLSLAKNNYIYAMVPQKQLYLPDLINKFKWSNFRFITHSHFVENFIAFWTGIESIVLYPFIDEVFSQTPIKTKKKQILSVGRFFGHIHSKRQDILIESFNKLKQKSKMFKDFKLILAGGLVEDDKDYLKSLKKLAKQDKNIEFIVNPSFEALLSLYHESLIYWHAAGYGIEQSEQPDLVEHLGITPLEAMAAGCVVFAHNSGGPKEIVKTGKTGFLYSDTNELINQTAKIIANQSLINKIRQNGKGFVKREFSYESFEKNVKEIFGI